MRNLGTPIELDPQGDKITCPAFGLFSSPAEHSTMGHIVLDLTSLTYQFTTRSSDRALPLPAKRRCKQGLPKTKADEKIKKEKVKKELFFNPDSQPVIGLMIPGLQMLGGSVQSLALHG